ncbi:hypothetical protein D3C80_1106560 [compost metagenome]
MIVWHQKHQLVCAIGPYLQVGCQYVVSEDAYIGTPVLNGLDRRVAKRFFHADTHVRVRRKESVEVLGKELDYS